MGEIEQHHGVFTLREGVVVRVWRVGRLWKLAEDLQMVDRPMDDFDLHTLLWPEGYQGMTVRHFIHHARRCRNVDVTYPIILNSEGMIMDGMHRLVALGTQGAKTVPTVQFEVDPEPDHTLNTLCIGSISRSSRARKRAPGRIPRLKSS